MKFKVGDRVRLNGKVLIFGGSVGTIVEVKGETIWWVSDANGVRYYSSTKTDELELLKEDE